MRRITAVLAAAVLAAGCGDALQGVGDLSSDFVRGDVTTTSETVVDTGPDLGLTGITGVTWINDALDLTGSGSREVLLRDVWRRGDQQSAALP